VAVEGGGLGWGGDSDVGGTGVRGRVFGEKA
jgi:hypothetical protein